MNIQDDILVDRSFLETRLEPFLLDRLPCDRKRFRVRMYHSELTPNRLDVAVKLALLESELLHPARFPIRLYDAHIHAFSLGDMTEPGSLEKNGADSFRAAFFRLRNSFSKSGFDPSLSLMPIASDGTILNGGHRAACALHLGLPLMGVETELEPVCYDWAYFRDRGMATEDLDAMALAYLDQAPDAALALLWPAAPAQSAKAEKLLGMAAYRREVFLTPKGAHNLLSQVYAGEEWLGPRDQDFPGIAAKLAPCFSSPRPLRLLALSLPPSIDRVALKEKVRRMLGHDKHTIHITDTRTEAIDIARLLLNPNGRHFLDHASPNRFPTVAAKVSEFRREFSGRGGDVRFTALDTGIVLGAYGLREPGDVDFRSAEPLELPPPFERHVTSDSNILLGDILSDPKMHFHFWGQRFVALPLVADMKRRRLAGRDREDLLLIEELMTQQHDSRAEKRAIRRRVARARLRRRLIHILAAMNLRDPVKVIYHKIRRHR